MTASEAATAGASRRRDPVRTVFLGSGAFARPILATLADHPAVDLVGVVSAPPRPVGRGGALTPTPVDVTARERGLAVLTPVRLREPASVGAVLALGPDLVVLADYGQIVPPALLDRRHGALNLHPSLLPRHRGATPIPAAILAGDRETGVTLMRMDEGLDTGPVVAVERLPLRGDETAPELETVLAALAADLLRRSLDGWLGGALPARAQSTTGVTMTRPLRRSDGRLDPARPAPELERQVRAHLPWPGSFLEVGDERLVVLAAEVAPGAAGDAPGTLVADGRGLALATSGGRLRLLEVTPAGGRPMSGEALVRGRPAIIGRTVRSA